MSKLIIALVVVSFIVALGFISDGIARYIENKKEQNKDE
jgi:hypothetical protein